MRQLRIKSSLCQVQKIMRYCQDDYSFFNEDKQSFQPGWTANQTTQIYSSSIDGAFIYQAGDELDTYINIGNHGTYNTGGYVYDYHGRLLDLQGNLSQLHQLEWIDDRTRAVIIQMSLYNPNSQLFTSATFLTEFLSTGGLFPESLFEPISFQGIDFYETSQTPFPITDHDRHLDNVPLNHRP
jgi:hypothetical protein